MSVVITFDQTDEVIAKLKKPDLRWARQILTRDMKITFNSSGGNIGLSWKPVLVRKGKKGNFKPLMATRNMFKSIRTIADKSNLFIQLDKTAPWAKGAGGIIDIVTLLNKGGKFMPPRPMGDISKGAVEEFKDGYRRRL